MPDMPPILHVVGSKNSGKTRLVEKLIQELTNCGLKIGALKHSMHTHPIDKPGSDSDRLRQAGAQPAAFWSENGLGIYYPPLESDEGWRLLRSVFANCDLVLVESFGSASNPKIVLEDGNGNWENFENVIALVSDQNPKTKRLVFKSNETNRLIQFILEYFHLADHCTS